MLQSSNIPLSLYIHIPWCVAKCPYCDFNSHQKPEVLPSRAYLDCLLADWRSQLAFIQGRSLHSIFIGGGTPSLMPAWFYQELFAAIAEDIVWPRQVEVTLEANPGTIEHDHFSAYQQVGINRISLGVQSFQPQLLKALGRVHGVSEIADAIGQIKKAGFASFNLDIMHGLPRQSLEQAQDDLRQALGYQPDHLSWYQLTLEPNTLFHHQPPPLPAEEVLEQVESSGFALLTQSGRVRYEVSAWSRPGFECQHNLNYWRFGDYIGIGAGACGKVTLDSTSQVIRTSKYKHPKQYLRGDNNFARPKQVVSGSDLVAEYMLNLCRLLSGFTLSDFETKTGLNRQVLANPLAKAKQFKLLRQQNDVYQPTDLGVKFHNNLVGLFLP